MDDELMCSFRIGVEIQATPKMFPKSSSEFRVGVFDNEEKETKGISILSDTLLWYLSSQVWCSSSLRFNLKNPINYWSCRDCVMSLLGHREPSHQIRG